MDNDTFLHLVNQKLLNEKCVNFAVGQPDFKPAKEIIDAYKNNIETHTGYTPIQGLPILQKVIKQKLLKENKISVEEVLITTGAIESIFDIILTYLKPNDGLILFTPSYPKYRSIAERLNVHIKNIPLKKNIFDISLIEKSITKKTKMIILNSPHNPTGIVFSEDEIKQICEIAKKYKILLISDEVYEKYLYENAIHFSPARINNNVLTINSFSKTYGFPGLRIGYVAGPKTLIKPVITTHQSNTTCSFYAAQLAALAALQLEKPPFDINIFDQRRTYLIKQLEQMGLSFIYPKGAFYIYVYIEENALNFCYKLLKDNLLVMPSTFYEHENKAIRLSYAVNMECIEKGLSILHKHLDK